MLGKAIEGNNHLAARKILKVLDSSDLIPGVEIITSYKGVIIEVLGYDIDIDKLDEQLKEKSQGLEATKEVLYKGLNRVITETDIIFNRDVLENVNALVGPFYKELMSHEENRRLFEDITQVDSLKKFIYNYLYNPDSPFFVNMSQTRPNIKDVIQMIHDAGGKASLAHPGRYKSLDMKKEIDEIIKLGLDGIEVYYPDHSKEYRGFLLGKVREYNLIATGGSDDHSNKKEGDQYYMGSVDLPVNSETAWLENSRSFTEISAKIKNFRERLQMLIESDEDIEKSNISKRNITKREGKEEQER